MLVLCGEGTDSVRLKYGKKFAYMGHRKHLKDMKHPFRSQKSQFNGKEEYEKPPKRLSGSEDLPIRHNLDVMHVEKNVAENLIATIMNIKDKSKDDLKAHQDLKEMRIKKKLWPVENNGKLTYLNASYTLSRHEKDLICKTLFHLKVPIRYGDYWKHKVSLEDRELKNLKSHDYHILM
ncbi:hypothetical protein AAC387_Pa03g1955 [Persea americana]